MKVNEPTPEQIVYNVAQLDPGFRRHLIEQLTAMGDGVVRMNKVNETDSVNENQTRDFPRSGSQATPELNAVNADLRRVLGRALREGRHGPMCDRSRCVCWKAEACELRARDRATQVTESGVSSALSDDTVAGSVQHESKSLVSSY